MKNTAFSDTIMELRYSWDKPDGSKESWEEICARVVNAVFSVADFQDKQNLLNELFLFMQERKFIAGGRFLAQAGRDYHQTNNCFLLRAEDTREGWGNLTQKATVMLMSGGGIGIDYSALRPAGSPLKRSGGTSSGVLPLANIINEIGRGVMSGGKRRSAIWGGLRWNHGDIFEWINAKNWSDDIKAMKAKNFDAVAPLDMTNISVILDKDFFSAFEDADNELYEHAQKVYWTVVENMVKTGEPAFSVDYDNPNESLRNACCEIVSEDDSDVCCLGSINMGNIQSIEELRKITDLATLFLLLGTEYSDSPHEKVKQVKQKNRRLGLGLMGLHEWLIKRGYEYEPNAELGVWLRAWKNESDRAAKKWARILGYNEPVKKRAIAPNGVTSIAGGRTTSGLEPIFALAYQRIYITPEGHKLQYVVDPVAERLHEEGFDMNKVQDAYTLSFTVEKRVAFQAFVQQFVDNGISSTVNLPAYGSKGNDDYEKFGTMLYRYLPFLRGITAYPDGSRSGQPITPVDFEYARERLGVVFEADEESCAGGICGV